MSLAITGSTGKYGSLLIDALSRRVAPSSIIAITRDTQSEKARSLPSGVILRQGDFADSASLVKAFNGANKLVIVSVDKIGDEALRLHRAAADAAVEAGVSKIFYTSHLAASPTSSFQPAREHYEFEQYLGDLAKDGKIQSYTALRNGFYMTSFPDMTRGFEFSQSIAKPQDGKVAWTHHEDLADAAAALLAEDDAKPTGKVVSLTNSSQWDMQDAALILTRILGKEITRVTLGVDEYIQGVVSRGVPKAFAEMYAGFFKAAEDGEFVKEGDATLEQLIRKRPIALETFLEEHYAKR